MKRFIILTILAASFTLSTFSQGKCETFRTGKFKIQNPEDGLVLIERNDSIQIEESEKYGMIIKFRINWLDDCSYELRISEIVKDISGFEYPKDLVTTVRITEVYEDYCLQEATSNAFDVIVHAKLERINE